MALTEQVIMPGADYQDACDAIREKTGGTDLIKSGEMGGLIRGIETGSTPAYVEEKDVNFWDYDGTLLYSYTLDEVQALTELPPAPTPKRDFLTFQEWNWTLDDIKSLHLPLSVAAVVRPKDGKTRAFIEVIDARFATVTLNLAQRSGAALSIDWGDETAPTEYESVTSDTLREIPHTYETAGEYIVTITATGKYSLGNYSTLASFVFSGSGNAARTIAGFLTELYVGDNTTLIKSCMKYCASLRVATLPVGATSVADNAFQECRGLRFASLPSTIKTIGPYAFAAATSLTVISIPKAVTSISYYAFNDSGLRTVAIPLKSSNSGSRYNRANTIYIPEGVQKIDGEMARSNYALNGIIEIPSTVQTIGGQAFYDCYNLKKIIFKPTTPPTVSNANAFTSLSTNCIIEVPADSLTAYQEATNYSGIAAQMVGGAN